MQYFTLFRTKCIEYMDPFLCFCILVMSCVCLCECACVCGCMCLPKAKGGGDFPHFGEVGCRGLFQQLFQLGSQERNSRRRIGTAVTTDSMPHTSPHRFLSRAVKVFLFTFYVTSVF